MLEQGGGGRGGGGGGGFLKLFLCAGSSMGVNADWDIAVVACSVE